jgi:colanic acid/amylovoran biosynthesis protein
MTADRPLRVATLGGAFSGNKGSASMLFALLDNLPEMVGGCRFDVLTTYPGEDANEPRAGEVTLHSASPKLLAFVLFPLAVLAAIGRVVHLPVKVFCRTPALRALADADVVVDLAGISFADGRGIPTLGYNVLMTSLPILLGRPVVKASQALGPFEESLNRFAAKRVLRRVATVCARGAGTARHLAELGLSNVVNAADLAFTMRVPEEAARRAHDLLEGRSGLVVVLPSAVVDASCRKVGIDYAGVMSTFIDQVAAAGRSHPVLVPHSARPGHPESKMNDVPVCRRIHQSLAPGTDCTLLDDNFPPDVLRAVIGAADVTVTSRFHAMVSALATATPVVVVGWSHKYGEVLDAFGVTGCDVAYTDLDGDTLMARFADVEGRREEIVAHIQAALPNVRDSSAENYRVIAAAALSERDRP